MFDRDNRDYTQVSQIYGLQARDGAHDVRWSGFVFFGVSDIEVRGNVALLKIDSFQGLFFGASRIHVTPAPAASNVGTNG